MKFDIISGVATIVFAFSTAAAFAQSQSRTNLAGQPGQRVQSG
jgi:hypothetical protein